MLSIPKSYNHEEFEEKIYQNWEKSGYFKGQIEEGKKPFVIMMPPPNVTGKLHIGHSLVTTLEDLMTRYNRLLGRPSLWLPGMDHAGIATQTVVDKDLKQKGIDKKDLGREKFVEKVWQWKEEKGGIILKQIRRMGASCDWSRERFTLDEGMSEAVNEALVELYKKDLIYRGEYIVNWCPDCHTAIADDEVDHREQKAKLFYFHYDKNFPITIATTRPETKLGDTAVAVNPTDKRYIKYIGQEFDIDLDGIKRKIKIIGDRAIDMKFGTGAVGVTPAHSLVDWKMAEENDLPKIKVIDEDGKMTSEAGKYKGMPAKEAGKKLVLYLKANGLLEKEEDYLNNLSVCYRCETPVEPIPSLQWFVKMKPLAEKAKKAVKSGEIKIIPARFEKVYFHWLDNIRDWCISRQLWWGHRLPVYYRKQEAILNSQFSILNKSPNDKIKNEKINENWKMEIDKSDLYVGKEPPKDIENWVQDEDVLDTWFSAALWPFSTLGWPKKTKDLEYFFPTTVLETGYDILFFWVARMIMLSLELTGKIPFETVYLHGLVRDEKNRKMSKSLGNQMDPLDIIPKYGADALRMALVVGTTPGQDIAVDEDKIKGYRNFSNKIWNASRFVILNISKGDLQSGEIGSEKIADLNIDSTILTKADKEILKKHEETVKSVTKKLDQYRFSQAGEELYEYFWHQFCDKYIEQAKSQLANSKHEIRNPKSPPLAGSRQNAGQIPNSNIQIPNNTKKILLKILSETLVMLHPFTPFVTEAVWQETRNIYPKLSESIMIAGWPK